MTDEIIDQNARLAAAARIMEGQMVMWKLKCHMARKERDYYIDTLEFARAGIKMYRGKYYAARREVEDLKRRLASIE